MPRSWILHAPRLPIVHRAIDHDMGGAMRYTLIESRGRRTRRTGGTLISIGMHTALGGAAVVLTARAAPAPVRAAHDIVAVIYTAPRHLSAPALAPVPVAPRVASIPRIALPAVAPATIPDRLPAIDPHAVAVDPRAIAAGPVLGPDAPGAPATAPGFGPADGIYDAAMVDRAVEPDGGNPRPVYPGLLRAAGVEGTVVVRFVVDTMGRAELGSIGIVSSTHPLFADAVRAALARSRFRPAEAHGHRVRQLVEQRFEFALRR